MRTPVTVIVVARKGGEWLSRTLSAVAAQTHAPARVIAVAVGGSDRLSAQLTEAGGLDRVVTLDRARSFGEAVQAGISAAPLIVPEASATETGSLRQEWFWLLPEDAAPEPEALGKIVATVQRAPSVAMAGPKLVDWDRPDRIIELGQSLTRTGSRWLLRRQELDQQQYDHLQDVLGVGPVGLLVRRDVWEQLGGFDPGLPIYDDALDLSVRARLAGYRVVVAPASRVRFAQSGIAGPRIDRSRSVMRAANRNGRISHLHRRITYAPAIIAFFMWLGLPLYGLGCAVWALIREQPGNIPGEIFAALRVFFSPASLLRSRRRLRQQNSTGWGSIRQLRVDPKSVRTTRMIEREVILASQGLEKRDLNFVGSGGLATLLGVSVVAIALTWWAFSQTSLTGGSLAPLSGLRELWAGTRIVDGVPADPFTWVLALLGTVTFWNPSHALVLLTIAAMPLAALGGWIWAARLTENPAGRALLALGWSLSPALLGSLAGGRIATLILAVVLPWLLLATTRCRESWSWAGTASLLTAVALACAPILIPVAVLFLVVGVLSSLRGAARVLSIAIAPAVLFAPKIVFSIVEGRPLDLLMDPGITPAFEVATPWHLLLGFPEFGLEGWGTILATIGLGGAPATLLVGVLLLPIVLLAALGLFTGHVFGTLLHALLGAAGLVTAVVSGNLLLHIQGSGAVAVWTGSGLMLYWISVLGLAAVGVSALRRAAAPVTTIALIGAVAVAAPLGVRLVLSNTDIAPGHTQMPAIVQAEGTSNPSVGTLRLAAADEGGLLATLARGQGLRLDQIRTAERTPDTTEQDRWVAEITGELASATTSARLDGELAERNIGFVLLADSGGTGAERARIQAALDQHVELSSVGPTAHGLLWRVHTVSEADTGIADDSRSLVGTTVSGHTVWWVQLAVLLGMVLLALPTGEVVARPERRRRPSRRVSRPRAEAAAVAAAESAPEAVTPAETAPGGDPVSAEPEGSEPENTEPENSEPEKLEPTDERREPHAD